MKYKKIAEKLLEAELIDERFLMCHSYSTVTTKVNNYVLFSEVETIRQPGLPYFMILSIKDDKLHISRAGAFGGYKGHFRYIELNKLRYLSSTKFNFSDISYKFQVVDEEGSGRGFFYINVVSKKDEAKKLVDEIIAFNKKSADE